MFVVTLPASADPKAFAKQAKQAGAQMLEIRTDLTPKLKPFDSILPIIVAIRGKSGTDLVDSLQPAFVDIDSTYAANMTSLLRKDVKLILSYHNYKHTPSATELEVLTQKMLAVKPDIIKIATKVNTYADIAALESLRAALPSKQKAVILAMGELAHPQRQLSPFRNVLTYTYIDQGEEAAEGQISLEAYQGYTWCKKPKMYGLLCGNHLRGSLSPIIHNLLLLQHDIDALYTIFPTDNLVDAFQNTAKLGVQGFSVTTPWKRDILPLLDRLDPLARQLQSVNTVIQEQGKWVGYNTDVQGFIQAYPFLRTAKSAAIIGSGGVVSSVIFSLRQLGIDELTIFARNEADRKRLHQEFSVDVQPMENLEGVDAEVIVCALSEDVDVFLPEGDEERHFIDLRYARETKALTTAEALGYSVHDGFLMLIHQAIAQFLLFTQTVPDHNLLESLLTSLMSHGQ